MNEIKETIKDLILTEKLDSTSVVKSQRRIMKRMKTFAPSKMSLLKAYHEMTFKEKEDVAKSVGIKHTIQRDEKIKELLITRPVRSLSGIVNVSVLTKPYPCPGQCIYCPNENDMPKSYIKSEPAAMRAAINKFDPTKQVNVRIKSLSLAGHPVEKIDLRIIGGNWSSYPKNYQTKFIKSVYDTCNDRKSQTLKQAQKLNESAKHKIVGLSIETRPDFVNEKEIERLRELGVTAVELGIQIIDEKILKGVKRGHGVESITVATKLLKNAGFKICYQMMPNLPGSNIKKDLEIFKTLFNDPRFKPDHLKIYPTVTIKNTILYDMWKRGEYTPYSDKDLKSLMKRVKALIPKYVRIQRLIRDIPAQEIEAGTTLSNMRELIAKESKKEGWSCQCIRCREVRGFYDPLDDISLFREDYDASDGREIFLSFEDVGRKRIYSLLKLRISEKAIIREVHTYGKQLPTKKRRESSPQHKGFGKRLIEEAEKIVAKETDLKKLSVISAVGVRNYYRKLGYRLDKSYMSKKIK
ncbi:MAG: tRNA uridine(34) 5-carboxymethylaminomethyl modification radical SAM/GNAT enzyme Elp3 [Minisyncoccales bacterium]